MESRFASLDEWLRWQEQLHPAEIELGLERVAAVLAAMGRRLEGIPVVSVAGTNGKGSCVAMLESVYGAAGYRPGAYTSPHLLRYNERVRIAGKPVSDADLCRAFAAVDTARGALSLTYFEFGTLAAIYLFDEAGVDVALLEVGLGGRLDAVNIIDSDVALLTSVDLDHMDWLGPDRESIGREKAGIFRSGHPAVCADTAPPTSVLSEAGVLGADLLLAGRDYCWQHAGSGWRWQTGAGDALSLPYPALAGEVQIGNAAAVVQAVQCLQKRLPVSVDALGQGLQQVRCPGRCQRIPGPVEWLYDVAHNPAGALSLADFLATQSCRGKRRTVLGMLADKPAAEVIAILAEHTDEWYLVSLTGSRARSAGQLALELQAVAPDARYQLFDDMGDLMRRVESECTPGDRVLVTGSFLVVAGAQAHGADAGDGVASG